MSVVDLARASALAPIGCSSGQPGAGALDHGVPFKLGEGGHDGEHRLAHRAVGMQTFGLPCSLDSGKRSISRWSRPEGPITRKHQAFTLGKICITSRLLTHDCHFPAYFYVANAVCTAVRLTAGGTIWQSERCSI
jgi:hypothetical protein